MTTDAYRPALNLTYTGGSLVFIDPDSGDVKQIIGTQPDGTVGISNQNGAAPAAVSTPVVTAGTLGLTVTWDGRMAADTLGAALNANTDFETGPDSWVAQGGARLAQSGLQQHTGSFALAVTPDSALASVAVASELINVTGGTDYEATCWVRATDPVIANFSLSVDWFDSTGALLSTSAALVSLAATTWTQVLNAVTAPATAISAQLRPTLGNTPTHVFYLDDISLATVTSSVPTDFDHVEVHVSPTTGFTPSAVTLKGTLRHSGNFPVTPLTGGTTYFVRLVGVNTSGIFGAESAQASGIPSQLLAADADFTARDIGGITTTVGAVAPTGAVLGDVWIDTGNGNRFNQYDGANFVPLQWDTASLKAGSVTADVIGASQILAANIAANQIQANHLQANAVTAGKIAAGAITADALAATLVLGTQIIAGTQTGARVQLDPGGISVYDSAGNATIVMAADGTATFTGSTVSADEVDAESIVVNSPTNGGVFLYGSSNTALNANPNFTSSTAGWTATATLLSYSAVHTYNGHNTLRCARTDGPATVETSPAVTVIPGTQYQVAAVMLSSDGTPMYAQIRWFNAGGGLIATNTSPANAASSFTTGRLVAAGIAPAGAATAVIRLGFTVKSATGAFYVGAAGITATNIFSSLTNAPGVDVFGNAYPAGLQTATANIGTLSAGNINWGPSSTPTNASGQVIVTHGLGHDPNSIQLTPTVNCVYRPFIASHNGTTITVGFKDASDTVVTTGGHAANFYWFAAV